ncbi:MAG: hypothetical protein U1F43_36755 [Myxococcota bacterium]
MIGRATALSLALVASGWAPAAHAALDDDAVRARTREVLADPNFQTDRPDGNEPDVEDPAPPRPTPERSSAPSAPLQAPSEISQALIWIVLGGIAVFVLVLLGGQAARSLRQRKISSTRRGGPEPELELGPGMDLERLDETLRAAMALAADGRFEEAVHLLLTGAIADLQRGAGLTTEVALTSRELLSQAKLRPEPQAAFRELVFAVEVSLFGGMAVARDDFERCATSFRTLRQAVAA